MRDLRKLYLVVCMLAAVTPLIPGMTRGAAVEAESSGAVWPMQWDGRRLWRLPINTDEAIFFAQFPGELARFSDGRREILMRRIDRGTRLLHSSSYCFRGTGWSVRYLPLWVDAKGRRWSRFEAVKGDRRLTVSERIEDRAGQAWTDTSAWYWAAALERTQGPWLAVTLYEQGDGSARD